MAKLDNEKGYKLVLDELMDTNYVLSKEATVWSKLEGSDEDYVILYNYRRKGGEHFTDMVTLNEEEFARLAFAVGYVKEEA